MKIILQYILKILAQAILQKYKPKVIAVVGSVGKTSTKEVIAQVLYTKYRVGSTIANFNTELGVPTSILLQGIVNQHENPVLEFAKNFKESTENSKLQNYLFWAQVIKEGLLLLLLRNHQYPEILVLEFGEDHPGDIDYLSKLARPDYAVVTAMGKIPAHVEFYGSPKEVVRENSKVIKSLSFQGKAFLNFDEEVIRKMALNAKCPVETFGFKEGADLCAKNDQLELKDGKFFLNFSLSDERFCLNNVIGKYRIYSVLPAIGIARYFGFSLDEVKDALTTIHYPKRRFHLLRGKKNTLLIDDGYNSSPEAVKVAIESIEDLEVVIGKSRKVFILGDMLELGKYSESAHKEVGEWVRELADVVVAVGPYSKFLAEVCKEKLGKENVFYFENSDLAKEKVVNFIKEEDIILVKGSLGMNMNILVEELQA